MTANLGERLQVRQPRATSPFPTVDALVVVTIVLVGLFVFGAFQYRGELGEPDLYIVLNGLLNGHETGLGLADPLQYGRAFSYGYIEFIQVVAGFLNLESHDAMIALINDIGLVSAIVGLVLMWFCFRIVYGPVIGIVAIIIIGLSPMFIDLSTSGHQLLLGFALFAAGSLLLLIETSGWLKAVAFTAATVILFAGLTIRADIIFGFPWLVLAQKEPQTIPLSTYLRTAAWRTLVCFIAWALFFWLRSVLVTNPSGDEGGLANLGVFFRTYYSLSKIGPGFVYLVLGCGIATVLVAGIFALVEFKTLVSSRFASSTLRERLVFLAPLGLILPGLLFWLANPAPSRHFFFFLTGVSICIGLTAISTLKLTKVVAIGLAFATVAANQVMAELARPYVVRVLNSPLTNLPDTTRTLTLVPLGFFWKHHAILQSRRSAFTKVGEKIQTTCDPFLIVLTEEPHHLVSTLFTDRLKPTHLIFTHVGPYSGYSTEFGGRHLVYLTKSDHWPEDAVRYLLSDDTLSNYKIYVDPYGVTAFDRTPVPASREAKFGCSDSPADKLN